MPKQKLAPLPAKKSTKVSHFASSHQDDDPKQLKHQISIDSNSASSQKNELLEKQKDYRNSKETIDVMKEQELKLKQKGKLPEVNKKNVRRDSIQSVDSRISSESQDYEMDSEESDIDDQTPSNSPIHEHDEDIHHSPLDEIPEKLKSEIKAQNFAEQSEKVTLKLKKEDSKKSKNNKKNQKEGKKQKKASRKNKQVYGIDDFTITNSVGRNILHRQCLKQNHDIIQDLLTQYKKLREDEQNQQKQSQQQQLQQQQVFNFDEPTLSIEQMLQQYINGLDTFGNSPLILCCIQEFDDEENNRFQCLEILLKAGADINHRNPRTLWSALHWCAHFGDYKSIQLLLEFIPVQFNTPIGSPIQGSPRQQIQSRQYRKVSQTYQCFPDQEGLYPIDLAGLNGSKESTFALIEHIIKEIKEVEKMSHRGLNEDEISIYQPKQDKLFMKQQRIKYLKSPILRSRILYWAAYFPDEKSMNFIKDAFTFEQTYVMAKQKYIFNYCSFFLHTIRPHQSYMTSLHAAAKYKNTEILDFLADNIRFKNSADKTQWMEKQLAERSSKEYSFNIYNNSVLSLIIGEDSLYKQNFIDQIKEFDKWETQFIITHRKYKQNSSKYTFIDQKDLYGNTALHLASINGFAEGVQILLNNGSDIETENKEGWRPRELVQHPSIRQIYQQALEKNQGLTEQLKAMNKQIEETIKMYNVYEEEQIAHANKLREKDLYAFGTKLFLPDFVIVFSLGKNADSNMNRINFQIGVLKKSRFNVYLLESVTPDRFFILVGMTEKNLQAACKENKVFKHLNYCLFTIQIEVIRLLCKMQMKLIDSYDYEPYNVETVTKFEPFRSKQRQEILEIQLNKIINLQDLKSQKLIQSYYKMHTYGGIARIKDQWVSETRWYWPQPLNQLDDYLLEDKNQNFTSVTLLRQYFGEKIAFFFGWKSFITCFMILIAVPGLALQIYIIQERSTDYNNILISFWVFYVMIWSTVIVEYWKRKTSEINYRWGTLDMMNNPDIINKTVRDDFIGDECISSVTGGLTKYQKKSKTVLKLLVSVPVLVGLMVLVVYIFLKIDEFKKSLTNGDANDPTNNFYKSLAGVLQGVGIQVLNFIYTLLARYFAKKENHKYEFQYERSIIYKLMAFKVLNSYFALFYIGFLQSDSNFSTLFFMLLPIMLIKQVNYTLFNVWLPIYLYNRAQRNYFTRVRNQMTEHQLVQGQLDPELTQENQDIIEQYWNDISKDDMKNLNRSVISLQEGEDIDKNEKKELAPSIKLIRHIDVDSIELNSLRQEFLDTVNFYADGFIDLGYITLFASAFPIGPFISMMMNSLEIRNKLNVFMYVLKRPTCQRCAGIGDWLFIWQCFSFVSVISNIGLLYQKDQKLVNLILDESQYTANELKTLKTWIYIGLAIFIIGLKYLFQAVIQDKPEWIRREEEKWSYQLQIQKEKDEKLLQAHKKEREIYEKKFKDKVLEIKDEYVGQMAKQDDVIDDLEEKIKILKQHCPENIVQLISNKNYSQIEGENQIGKSGVFKVKTEFQMKIFGILRSTYIKIERELLIQRMKQLETMNVGTIMICNECGRKLSIFECQTCDMTFCQKCFDEYHNFINQKNHPIKILNYKSHKPGQYSDYSVINDENTQLIETKINNFTEGDGNSNKLENQSQIKKKIKNEIDKWRKFEYFVLPTYKKSPMYGLLEEEYIENNGIDETNEQIDFKKVFKLKEKAELKGKFVIQESRAFTKLLQLEEFNIEDKLFLNRIAFLIFKRHGQKTTFSNFYNICKILQEGLAEQKFILLLDFIDEDDSQVIDKDEIKKIFYSSFLQTSEEEQKIDAVIDNLFKDNKQLSKVDIGKSFIYSQELNPFLNSFLISLLQDRKN